MKKLMVKDGCIACGACVSLSSLLEENEEGKAVVVGKGFVDHVSAQQLDELISICPVQAISVVEENSITKASIEKAINIIRGYEIPEPSSGECPFNKSEYVIDLPSANGEYRYDYKSYERAERAGLEEFDRQMYAQKEKIIRKIFT